MKKVGKVFASFFIGIYKIIDKCIVTPISHLVYKISQIFKSNSSVIEKIINKKNALIYISLIFAVLMFFLVDSKVISLVETEAEILADQKVEVLYNEEAYVVKGIPETIDITLIGRKSDLYLAKQLGDHEVILDLTGYGVGEHEVQLSYKQTIDTLSYKLDPSTVLVVIREKISTLKDVSYDLLNQDKLDPKLSVEKVELDRSEVVVKGSEESLEKVATVKALIDLNNKDLELKSAGEYLLEKVPLVAYDEHGKVISDVEVVPETLSATLTLDSYSVEVPLKVLTSGKYTVGYAISTIAPSVTKVTIYGEKEVLDTISYVPVTIDVTGLKTNKTFNVNIPRPSGVRSMSENTVAIDVTVATEISREITGITIEIKNLKDGFMANAKSIEDTQITIGIKGVESVLNEVEASDITAYVDLTKYDEAGTYSVPVTVEIDDARVQLPSSPPEIEIVIEKK